MDEAKCGFDGCETGQPGLEACWPIPIPEEDPDFPYNRCLKFVRSQEVPALSCGYGMSERKIPQKQFDCPFYKSGCKNNLSQDQFVNG